MKLSIIAASLLSALALTEAATTPVCKEKHSVTQGDTCQSIATKYGITEADIKQWNKDLKSQFDCATVKNGDSICVKYATSSSKRKRRNNQVEKAKPTDAKFQAENSTGSRFSGAPNGAKPSSSAEKRSNKAESFEKAKPKGSKKANTKISGGVPTESRFSGEPNGAKPSSSAEKRSNKGESFEKAKPEGSKKANTKLSGGKSNGAKPTDIPDNEEEEGSKANQDSDSD